MPRTIFLPLAVSAGLLAALPATPLRADVVTQWNALAVTATKTGLDNTSGPRLNSNLATRVHAIAALAVHDAVVAALGGGQAYLYDKPALAGASPHAAAAQGAHDVLVKLVPGTRNAQVPLLDTQLADTLKGIETSGVGAAAIQAGVDAGKSAAALILAARELDGATPDRTDSGPAAPGIGEWRPTPVAQSDGSLRFPAGINRQWGEVTPFVVKRIAHLRPPKPPRVDSSPYRKAWREIKALGRSTGSTRITDQTHQARFWRQDAELPVNQAARQMAEHYQFGIKRNARLFAELDTALADVRIALWAAKYRNNYWRPVTALNADINGAVTNNYVAWTPLGTTPSHPEYPADHAATAAAGIEILRGYFGEYQNLVLSTTTTGLTPATRTLTRLSQFRKEAEDSRVYDGADFRFAVTAGRKLGVDVARAARRRFP
jgi:hypothetical protein